MIKDQVAKRIKAAKSKDRKVIEAKLKGIFIIHHYHLDMDGKLSVKTGEVTDKKTRLMIYNLISLRIAELRSSGESQHMSDILGEWTDESLFEKYNPLIEMLEKWMKENPPDRDVWNLPPDYFLARAIELLDKAGKLPHFQIRQYANRTIVVSSDEPDRTLFYVRPSSVKIDNGVVSGSPIFIQPYIANTEKGAGAAQEPGEGVFRDLLGDRREPRHSRGHHRARGAHAHRGVVDLLRPRLTLSGGPRRPPAARRGHEGDLTCSAYDSRGARWCDTPDEPSSPRRPSP